MPAPSPLEAGACPRHPERQASLTCAGCGSSICVDCGGEHERRRYCDACLASSFERAAAVEAARSRGMSGVTAGLIAIGLVATILGGVYLLARPSIERAKERGRWRMCQTGLDKVFDAARLYAEDNRRVLPRGKDGSTQGLIEQLVETGYLREAPRNVTAGSVALEERTLDADPMAIYVIDDASHGVEPDLKRHVLRVDGTVSRMTEAEVATEQAKASAVTRTAQPIVTVTPTAGTGAGTGTGGK